MGLEVGMIVEGKVASITKFGAFIDLPDGKTGMVHISEIAPTFVNEIRDFLTEGQVVKVKVINVSEDGKIGLSVKKALPQQTRTQQSYRRNGNNGGGRSSRPNGYEWQPSKREPASFEDMMAKFKQTSDEKMSDLKRANESRRGGYQRRGGGNQQKN